MNYLNIIGLLLSILGIAIAYIQILSLKQITEATRKEVKASIQLNNAILLISDISKKVSMISEIQGFIRDGKIEMCILRIKDLKILFNDLLNHEEFKSLVNKKEFTNSQTNLNLDLHNFQKHLINEANKIDKGIVIENLEGLSSLLLNVEVKLKKLNQ